jgi:hypothetical protein
MPRRHNTAVTNETKHPYIVEVAAVGDGLDTELSRRIMQFHKSRYIQPRYGRRIATKRGKVFYRWCFSDLLIARAFAEEFGAVFSKPSV